MTTPGVHVETLHSPTLYTPAQIVRAAAIASALRRGKFVLVEAPQR